MTPLLKFNTQSFFALDQAETRTLLDWFEWAHKYATTPGDLRMASKLYAFRGIDPPPRLRHLFEQQAEPKRLLSAGTMMRWLLEHRYKPDELGIWVSPDIGLDFLPAMWKYCGTTDPGGYKWLPEWFEGEK